MLTEGLDRARERRRVVGDEDRGGTRRGSGKERCGGAPGLLIRPGRPCVFRDGAPGSAGARTRRCGVTGESAWRSERAVVLVFGDGCSVAVGHREGSQGSIKGGAGT